MHPDGKTVAYVYINQKTQHEQIMLADLTTGQSKPLTGTDATQVFNVELTWSPDGEWLAWGAADPTVLAPGGGGLRAAAATTHPFLQDVWVIKRDGTGLHRLADIGESQPSLAWSPDGVYVYAHGFDQLLAHQARGRGEGDHRRGFAQRPAARREQALAMPSA